MYNISKIQKHERERTRKESVINFVFTYVFYISLFFFF